MICPHGCGVGLKQADDGKSPVGVHKCPKCKCVFRMIVVNNDAICLQKRRKKQ